MTSEGNARHSSSKFVDLAVIVAISIVGLVAAWLTFGILESSASSNVQQYSVGGALAGAVVSWTLLFGFYFQARRSNRDLERMTQQHVREVEDLYQWIYELQQKVMRSAPIPRNFVPEIAERQHLVLARPESWGQTGGVIFQFQGPESLPSEEFDPFPPEFTLSYFTRAGDESDVDSYYKMYSDSIEEAEWVDNFNTEFVRIGGPEESGIKSLKIIARELGSLHLSRQEFSGRIDRNFEPLTPFYFWLAKRVLELHHEYRSGAPEGDVGELGSGPIAGDITVDEPISASNLSRTPYSDPPGTPSELAMEVAEVDHDLLQYLLQDDIVQSMTSEIERSEVEDLLEQIVINFADFTSEEYWRFVAGELSNITLCVEMMRMRVLCYHRELSTVYQFDFVEDAAHFQDSSHIFNQLLNSVRFLN